MEFKEIKKEFQNRMLERLEMGKKKYGEFDFLKKDNLKEMEDELIDIANYALMQYAKLKWFRKWKMKHFLS